MHSYLNTLTHAYTNPHTQTHRQSQNIHLCLNKCTQATPNCFQLVRRLGSDVHLAMRLHQQATIRDLCMPNPDSHIDRLKQGICIKPGYPCEIAERGIECTVITTVVRLFQCHSCVHVRFCITRPIRLSPGYVSPNSAPLVTNFTFRAKCIFFQV